MPTPEQLARKYMSPRSIELDRLDAYVRGDQYEGRPGWFDEESGTPLLERAPCIDYPIATTAIGSHVAFVLGEGRWPELSAASTEDDEDIDEDWGLDEDDSATLGRFVNVVLVRYAALKAIARQMLGDAMAARSVAVVGSVQSGRLVAEAIKAAWCSPTLDALGNCTKLEVRYPYIEDHFDNDRGCWDRRCLLYRRTIDAKSDTVYLPAKARADGKEPAWQVDKTKTREHGLGFCPVIWYPFRKPASTVANIDGRALHETQTDEIDALNIALSQKQRAAIKAGDPQMVETGVEEGYNPAPVGRTSRGTIDIKATGPDGKPFGIFSSVPTTGPRQAGMARKRGAGVIWSYTSDKAKVAYLTIPGDALKAIDEHARDLRDKIAESLFAVFIDPTNLHTRGALSGNALELMFSRQLSFDDEVREDFADKALLPLVSMLLRIVYVVGGKNPSALYMPGVKKVLPILASFERDVEGSSDKTWLPPRLEPLWGPYFKPGEQEQLFVVQATVAALQAGAITTELAVQKLASSGVFDIGSAQAVVDAINDEKQQKQADLHDAMTALHGGQGDAGKPGPAAPAPGGTSGGDPAPARAKAPPRAPGRRKRAA